MERGAPLSRWSTALASIDPAAAGLLHRLVSILVSLVVLFIVSRLVLRVIVRVAASPEAVRAPRIRTVTELLGNVVRWLFGLAVLLVVLSEIGIDVRGLLVSAGLVGLAVGFGAQTLVRDLLAGVFLLFEGVIGVGDLVEVGGRIGTVESVGLRVTRFRLQDGGLRVVPNGQLNDFVNLSSSWARVMIDVGVPREVDVSRALDVLREVGMTWARDTGAALDTPEAQGIIKFSGSDVILRLAVTVAPPRRLGAEAELRRRIKEAFDRERWPLVGVS